MDIRTAAVGVVTSKEKTYNIGFNGNDETQFDVNDIEELELCWKEFCREMDLPEDIVEYVERVS